MKSFLADNKLTINTIAILQALYIILFFSNGIGAITSFNVYLGFAVYSLLTLACLALSVWLLLPFSKCDGALKFLLFFVSLGQALFTAWIYLFSSCGEPALIRLW